MFAGIFKRFKRVKKFLLRGFFVGDKLNIIDQQNIAGAVFIVKCRGIVVADIMDQLVRKMLAAGVQHGFPRTLRLDLVHDGGEQMRFAKTGMAVDEQRIIRFAGIVCNIEGRRVGEAVGRTDDEVVERIVVIVIVAADSARAGF